MDVIKCLLKNKKGADKVISVYWFAIIIIIAGGVFGMVYSFYNAPYDVREIESNILSEKISDCISFQGKLNSQLISDGEFNSDFEDNFLINCKLNFKAESDKNWDKEIQYFSEINFYSPVDTENSLNEIKEGNENLRADCFIKDKKDKNYAKFSVCSEKRIYSLDEGNNQYLIKILVAVGKAEKNVKL